MSVTTKFDTVGADKAAREIAKISGGLGSMATTAGKASAALLGAGAAAGALVDDIVGQIDEMNTFAESTGLSIDTIKGLSLEAKRTGKDLKDLVPRDLAKRMREAGADSKLAADAFADLGIGLEDIEGMSADEALAKVIDGLHGMENETQRAAIASQLLGKNGRQMLSAFADGSASLDQMNALGREFGIDVGPDAQKAAAEWQQSTMELSLAFDHAKASVQPFIGTAASLVSDFALGATFAFRTVTESIDLIGNRMVLFATGEWGELASSLQEDGFGITHVLSEGMEAARSYSEALHGLTVDQAELLDVGEPEEAPMVRTFRASTSAVQDLRREYAALRADFAEDDEWMADLEARGDAVDEKMSGALESAQDYADADFWDTVLAKMDENIAKSESSADAFKAYVGAVAEGSISIAVNAAESIGNLAEEGTKASKAAAVAQFAISKALALREIFISSKKAFMAAAAIGPPQSFILQGVVVAQGIAAGAAVASQSAPSFHSGHGAVRAPDEYGALLRSRESVLTPGATQALGGPEAVAQLNGGMPATSGGPMALYLDSEAIGVAITRALDDRASAISQAFRGLTPAVR